MSRPASRILFLATETYRTGGIQRFNRTFLSACEELGLACDVLSLRDTPETISAQPQHPDTRIRGFSGQRIAFASAIMRTLVRTRFDSIVVGHINFLDMVAAMTKATPRRVGQLLLIAHGIEVWSGIHNVRRLAFRSLTQVLCVSRYTKQRLEEQVPRVPSSKFVVFPNALSKEWVDNASSLRPKSLVTTDQNYILSVTRLDEGDRYKGIVTALEAFSMLRDRTLRYVVVGKGNDMAFLRLVAERCGVADRVDFLGSLPDADLVRLYRECRAFVLPSGKEGFGIVFLEAMFFNAPVIAAHEKGARDVVIDGETGLTVQYGDVVGLRDALECLLADSVLADTLRANGRASVTGTGPFTFDNFTARCAQVLGFGD
jgi:glycosyltransferase involved in cell wall biosynthesis